MSKPSLEEIRLLKEKMKPILRPIEGYMGIGITWTDGEDSEICLKVLAKNEEARQAILKVMPAGPHRVEVIGVIEAL